MKLGIVRTGNVGCASVMAAAIRGSARKIPLVLRSEIFGQLLLRALATAITLGVLANTIVIPAFAKGHDMTGSARATAIQDWNIEANKFNPITQLPNQFAVYGTCMAKHGQSVG